METIHTKENKKFIKYFWGVLVVVALVYFFLHGKHNQNVQTNVNATSSTITEEDYTSPDTYAYSVDLLNALNSYHYASARDISLAADQDANSVLMNIIALLLEQNRNLSDGNNFISKYTSHSNQIISTSAKGCIAGSMLLVKANDDLIAFFRNTDQSDPKFQQEMSYQMAEYGSKTKEGYKLIYISAPAIGYLYFEGAKSENPAGPIPYKISKDERNSLLKKMVEDFGEKIKQDDRNYLTAKTHNAVLLAVKQLMSYVAYDTYEESDFTK